MLHRLKLSSMCLCRCSPGLTLDLQGRCAAPVAMSCRRLEWCESSGSIWKLLDPIKNKFYLYEDIDGLGWFPHSFSFRLDGKPDLCNIVCWHTDMTVMMYETPNFVDENGLYHFSRTVAVREVPSCLLVTCSVTSALQGEADAVFTNLAGKVILRCKGSLQKGCPTHILKTLVEEVERSGHLKSPNQQIQVCWHDGSTTVVTTE